MAPATPRGRSKLEAALDELVVVLLQAGEVAQHIHPFLKPMAAEGSALSPVSYTHLTLPTICSV